MAMHTPIAELTKPTEVPGVPGAVIVATANKRDLDGNYPAFIAMARRESMPEPFQYSTHLVYMVDEGERNGQWFSQLGNYDLTEDQAHSQLFARSDI